MIYEDELQHKIFHAVNEGFKACLEFLGENDTPWSFCSGMSF